MRYAEALTALIDQEYGTELRNHEFVAGRNPALNGKIDGPTRDTVAVENENMRIAGSVFGEQGVDDAFYKDDSIDFGVFDNCREYGLTVTVGDWTFCAYEHRNSDAICIEGCPTAEVQPYGPYGGDKYDVLFSTSWKQYNVAATALIAGMQAVKKTADLTRAAVKEIMKEGAVE